MSFKVIIAGGREFNDYELLKRYCDHILKDQQDIEIVCGCARGADSLGELYAREKGYPVTRFRANWDELGRSAGYIRNAEMGNYADALIAFWNNESKGTKHMIDIARSLNLKVRVCNY